MSVEESIKTLVDTIKQQDKEITELKRKLAIAEKALKNTTDACAFCENCPTEDDGECSECEFKMRY